MSTFHGRFALGQKTSSTQEPGLLGDERDDVVFRYDSNTGMYYNTNSGRVRVKWVQNTSGGALKPGTVVAWDTAGNMDTDVIQCTGVQAPAGIVDPFLSSDVADDERFLIVTKADRIEALSGGVFSKGSSLVPTTAGKVILGNGGQIRALEAAAGGDVLTEVSCDFGAKTPVIPGVALLHRSTTAAASITTADNVTLLPAVPGFKYRIHDAVMISNGATAGGATTVDIVGTQSSADVLIMSAAVAGLTDNTPLALAAANDAAGGASFAPCDANTAIRLGATGATVTTTTSITVMLTYELVAA